MFGNLLKAVVGAVVETPVSIAADFITLGGTLSDKQQYDNKTYTESAIKKVFENLEDSTK